MNKKDLSKDYIQQMVCGIKEDIEIAINSSILLEKNFWSSNDFFTHYELHVCGPEEHYTGKPISIKTGNQKEYKSRILFPFMTLQQYSRRANYFLDEVKAGRSTEPLTDSNSIGWKTTKYWGKKTNYVFVKFRLSKLRGPKEDGLIEYLMYEPIFSSTPTKVVDGNVSYSYFKKIDTRVLSYGLCLNNDIKSLFPVAEELPENNTAEIQNENYYINDADGKKYAFNPECHGEIPVSSTRAARTVREGLLAPSLTGGKIIGYHGSDIEFDTFDKSKITKRTDGIHGFYFSPEKRKAVAASYGPLKAYELVLENPLYLYRGFDIEEDSAVNSSGHDGIIVVWSGDSTKDSYSSDGYLSDGDIIEMIVFEPEQIKPIKVPKDTGGYLFGTAGESGGEERQKFNESLEDEFEVTDEPVEINNSYELRPTLDGFLELIVKEGVKKIDEELLTFQERRKIISVALPDSLKEIGGSTFDNCYSLTSIVIPPSVISVGSGAFYNCYSLTSISIPPSVTTIGNNTFYYCSSLTSITIPSSVEEIGSFAFYGCSRLESIYISSSVRTIKDFAFGYCSSLRDVFVTGCNSLEEQEQFKIKLKPARANSYRRVTLHFDDSNITEDLENYYQFDSEGNKLSPEQVEFFKDSKIRDKEGRLLVVYHGTGESFDSFERGDIGFHFGTRSQADVRSRDSSKKSDKWEVGKYYLNITNDVRLYDFNSFGPFTVAGYLVSQFEREEYALVDDKQLSLNPQELNKLKKAIDVSGNDMDWLKRDYSSNYNSSEAKYIRQLFNSKGFDGASYINNFEDVYTDINVGKDLSYIAFDASQIKSIDNKVPTSSNRFNESLEDEFEVTDEPIELALLFDLRAISPGRFELIFKPGIKTISREVFDLTEEEKEKIVSIIIPEGVEKIEQSTFFQFKNLESISIPPSVETIGSMAFFGCSSLKSIIIPSSVTSIGNVAFGECSSLVSVSIPPSVTTIGNSAFSFCYSLTSVIIPPSVTSIETGAFSSCTSLTSVTIPSSVTTIGAGAFSLCSSLTSITIPSSVTDIGQWAFNGCNSLTEIFIKGQTTSEQQENKLGLQRAAVNLDRVKVHFDNPSTITEGLNQEFEVTEEPIDLNFVDVNNFRYPEDMSREYSLEEQKQIKKVIVSEGTTKIEFQAFLNFSLLEEVIIPEGVKEIGNAAFAFCESLVSITLPSTVTKIGSEAFSNCTSLESITLPEGITIINNNTFAKCSSLKTITIPNSVEEIGFKAFYRCSLLSSININKTRSKLKSINHYAFNDCSSLKSLTFPNISGVLVIGEGVFSGCSSLERLDFHTIDVIFTSWLPEMFDQCSSLQSISGPVKLIKRLIPSILAQPAIKDIYITDVASIKEQGVQRGIMKTKGLDYNNKINIHFGSAPLHEDVENGFEITDEPIQLNSFDVNNFRYPEDMSAVSSAEEKAKITKIIVSDGVTEIPVNAFKYFNSLEEIKLSDSVEKIGDYAFCYCGDLKSITIPRRVKEIGDNAFAHCRSLASVKLKNGLVRIGAMAFSSCTSLRSIKIPDSVVELGAAAFYGCTTLESVLLSNNLTAIKTRAFSGCDRLKQIVIPDKVTVIGAEAFSGCADLSSVICHRDSSGLVKIEEGAFYNCPSLTLITLPNSLKEVRTRVFCLCEALTDLVFPSSITQISGFPFDFCYSLSSLTVPSHLVDTIAHAIVDSYSIKDIYITGAVSKKEQRRQVARLGRLGLELDKVNIHYESTLAT